MKRLQARETSTLIASRRKALETPFKGAWAGAEKGDVTLVMFTDYSCGIAGPAWPTLIACSQLTGDCGWYGAKSPFSGRGVRQRRVSR